MNKERSNEKDAKRIIEHVLRVDLEHADFTGGVDYKSADGEVAVEVTRVTDGGKKSARSALRASRSAAMPDVVLDNCWLVFLPDTQGGMRTILQDLPPLFAQLEYANVLVFDSQTAAVHVIENGPLADIYRCLLSAGVERASGSPHSSDPPHVHRVIPLLGSGGSSSGSDQAVEQLDAALAEKSDNITKLAASGARQRHLFVWLDDDTRFDISRPLSRSAPEWADEGFGEPTRAPDLSSEVTHLWVVHERSRLGWLWDGDRWHELQNLPERNAS